MKKTNIKLLFASSLLVSPLISTAASFDCTKASTQIEKTICGNDSISRLDEVLASAYKAAKLSSADPDRLQADQKEWVRSRNACKNEECVKTSYETRLGQLQPGAKKEKDGELNKITAKSKYEQGKESFEKKDYVLAFTFFNEALTEGNLEAEPMLGFLYVSGQGTTKDIARGINLLDQSVKRGNPKGMFTLGQLYYNGAFGVQKDQKHGLELLQASAKNGNEKAQSELQKLGIKSETSSSVASKMDSSECPPLDKNPGLQPVDNKAKEVTSKDDLSKFIKNTCDVLKDQVMSTVFRKGEVSEFMTCFFSKNELASMLKTRRYEDGITQGQAMNMIDARCPSFYAKRYDTYFKGIQDQQIRVAAQKEAEKETAIRKAEQEKVEKIAAEKAAEDSKVKKEADEKNRKVNILKSAIEKSGVPEQSRIVWMTSNSYLLDDVASKPENAQKNGLGNVILGDQVKLSGRFVFTPPQKSEFEKTDEYNMRVEKAKTVWKAEHPENQRLKRIELLLSEHLGMPIIKNLKYDADKEIFNFVIAGNYNNSVSIPGSMQIPRKDAEAAKSKLTKLVPIVIFEFKGDQMIARYVKFYYHNFNEESELRPSYTAPLRFNESEAKKLDAEAKKIGAEAKQVSASRKSDEMTTAVEALSYNTKPLCIAYSKQVEQLMPNRSMYEDRIWHVLEKAYNSGCL